MSNDKLIVFGQLRRKSGQLVPIHFIHEIEDDRCMIQVGDDMAYAAESYSSVKDWRTKRNTQLTESNDAL